MDGLKRELAEKNAEVESLREQCLSIADDTIIRVRGELMLEYKVGNTSHWNLDEDIQLMREMIEEEVAGRVEKQVDE